MSETRDGVKESRLSCPRSGTELADRLHMGMSPSEALGEQPLGVTEAVEQRAARGTRRSYIFAALLCVSLLGWPAAWYSARVAERADAEREAKESLAIEFEQLAERERAHAAHMQEELGLLQEQNDVLDVKQREIVLMMQEIVNTMLDTSESLEAAISDGRMEHAVGHFIAFCETIPEDNDLFQDEIDQFLDVLRDILQSVPQPSSPRG